MGKFTSKDGKVYYVEVTDNETTATDEDGDIVGEFQFRRIETPDGYDTRESLHLCHMDLGSAKKQGLGRFMLEETIRQSDMNITASDPHDLEKKDDGSHLIGDGPGFVEKMQKEGLIEGGGPPEDEDW